MNLLLIKRKIVADIHGDGLAALSQNFLVEVIGSLGSSEFEQTHSRKQCHLHQLVAGHSSDAFHPVERHMQLI
jgi:hypothetical protein